MPTSGDPLGKAKVMEIVDKEQPDFEGVIGSLDRGDVTGRVFMAEVMTAREFFVVECVDMTAIIGEQILKWQSQPTPIKLI